MIALAVLMLLGALLAWSSQDRAVALQVLLRQLRGILRQSWGGSEMVLERS